MSSVGEKFGKRIHRPALPSKYLVLPFAKVGVEVEVEGVARNPRPGPLWEYHEDHSLRNGGMEFTTRGGLVGEELVNAVEHIVDFCLKQKYSPGYPRAGIHLHIDVTDMNEKHPRQLANMMLSYILFEEAMFRFAGEWRKSCGFCEPLAVSQYDMPALSTLLYKWDKLVWDRALFSKYQAVNVLPLETFGTLEFRHLPTEFDAKRILQWINMCLSFKRFAIQSDVDPVDVLLMDGERALTDAVFGDMAESVRPYLREGDLYEALPNVLFLKELSSVKRSTDPWGEPDNPNIKRSQPLTGANGVARAEPGIELGLEDALADLVINRRPPVQVVLPPNEEAIERARRLFAPNIPQ